MNIFRRKLFWLGIIVLIIVVFVGWQASLKPATTGDWQTHLATPSTAEFNGNNITVKNIRNFRYGPTEADMHPGYYDKTFDLATLKKVWYVTEPFNGKKYAAHTFLSFEFEGDNFLSITIEARKTKDQQYSIWKGMMKTYPLIYIAADERDVVLLRANLRKDDVFVYPVNTTKENGQKLFVDMLERMNEMQTKPTWYNTFFANCTSSIAYHVNRVRDDRVPFSWKVWLTGYADELAYDVNLLDTDLSLEDARKKYRINEKSEAAGDVPDYSVQIRKFE